MQLDGVQNGLHLGCSAINCYELGALRSVKAGDECRFQIDNRTSESYELYWVDSTNALISYGIIHPVALDDGLTSYVGHSFVLKDKKKDEIVLSITFKAGRVLNRIQFDRLNRASVSIVPYPSLATVLFGSQLTEPFQMIDNASIDSSEDVRVHFINETTQSLDVSWIQPDGIVQKLNDTNEHTLQSCVGHTLIVHVSGDPQQIVYTVRLNEKTSIRSRLVGLSPTRIEIRPQEVLQHQAVYERLKMSGFVVYMEKGIDRFEIETMKKDLKAVASRLPVGALKKIQNVRVWVNKKAVFGPIDISEDWNGCCYHPDEGWLRENGNHLEKAKGVEIYSMADYNSMRHENNEPSVLIHELAHAFHDMIGFERKDVVDVYEAAMKEQLYQKVENLQGHQVKAYAATNPHEYFAELSVSYFAHGSYFPFTRQQLETYDSRGYQLIQKLWLERCRCTVS